MQPDLFTPEPALTAKDLADRLWLEAWLENRAEWATAHAIQVASAETLTDRAIRSVASTSEWIISGQKGYKHIKHSTQEEIHHASAWLESQAKKMSTRACTIRRNAHRILS